MTKYYTDPDGNYIGAFDGADPPLGAIEVPTAPEDARQKFLGGEWSAVPEPVPDIISDRQFFQELANRSVISQQEALAAVATGAIPAAMLALISQLPEEQQFPAQMLVSGATTFRRSHPIAALIGGLCGWTAEQTDDLWRAAFEL